MTSWELPVTVTVGGREMSIRSDFRAVLDAISALNDASMSDAERAAAFIEIMFPDWRDIGQANMTEAYKAAMTFINCGEPVKEDQPPKPKLVDWDRDVGLIAPAVDAVLGYSCRRCEYLHWWEFIGAYSNVGRGLFAEVVNIRSKRQKGKKLEKYEQEFMRDNPELISMAPQLTEEEEEFFKSLGV